MLTKRVLDALMTSWLDQPRYKGEWLQNRLRLFCVLKFHKPRSNPMETIKKMYFDYPGLKDLLTKVMGLYKDVTDSLKKAKKARDESRRFDKKFKLKEQRDLGFRIFDSEYTLDKIKAKRAALTLALSKVSAEHETQLEQQEDRLNKRGMYNLPLVCKELHEIIHSEEGLYGSDILTHPNGETFKIIEILRGA
jgi:hypothetical protein